MIRISMNVVSSAIKLLKYIEEGVASSASEIGSLYRIGDINVGDLVEFLENCGQLEGNANQYAITCQGKDIIFDVEKNNGERAIRRLLEGYVAYAAPLWSRRIPYGRNEAVLFMTEDEKSCFYEAALLNDYPDDDEVNWWDKMSQTIRKNSNDDKLETGRLGERLTISYEKARTGFTPQWKSIESNLVGYDIKSVVSKEDQTPLMIEVKTSKDSIGKALCHITANEWEVSLTAPAYYFYFWSLYNNSYKLAILSKEDIESHIPINSATGEWESVKIPFASFENSFDDWRT